jgi:pimeloyl-ACP methyl ester carboxylesterase
MTAREGLAAAPDGVQIFYTDRAPDPATYTVAHEVGDILALLDHLGLSRVAVIGTSRGGIQAMALAAARPDLVAGVALNDIGAEIAQPGLDNLLRALAAAPLDHDDWPAAEAALKAANVAAFPTLTDQDWRAFARRLYVERDGRPSRSYDPALVEVSAQAIGQPAPDLWPLFAALGPIPAAAIRGANSDILTAETLAAMAQAKPDLITATVPGRGHVPFLDEPEAMAAIDALLQRADRA